MFYTLTLLPQEDGAVATLGEPSMSISRGCGAYGQKCSCKAMFSPAGQPTVFQMHVRGLLLCTSADRYHPRQGEGTSGNNLGIIFDCSFRVAYVQLETKTVTKSCDCFFHVKMHDVTGETAQNRFDYACPCVGPLTATIDPCLVDQVLGDVAS